MLGQVWPAYATERKGVLAHLGMLRAYGMIPSDRSYYPNLTDAHVTEACSSAMRCVKMMLQTIEEDPDMPSGLRLCRRIHALTAIGACFTLGPPAAAQVDFETAVVGGEKVCVEAVQEYDHEV